MTTLQKMHRYFYQQHLTGACTTSTGYVLSVIQILLDDEAEFSERMFNEGAKANECGTDFYNVYIRIINEYHAQPKVDSF